MTVTLGAGDARVAFNLSPHTPRAMTRAGFQLSPNAPHIWRYHILRGHWVRVPGAAAPEQRRDVLLPASICQLNADELVSRTRSGTAGILALGAGVACGSEWEKAVRDKADATYGRCATMPMPDDTPPIFKVLQSVPRGLSAREAPLGLAVALIAGMCVQWSGRWGRGMKHACTDPVTQPAATMWLVRAAAAAGAAALTQASVAASRARGRSRRRGAGGSGGAAACLAGSRAAARRQQPRARAHTRPRPQRGGKTLWPHTTLPATLCDVFVVLLVTLAAEGVSWLRFAQDHIRFGDGTDAPSTHECWRAYDAAGCELHDALPNAAVVISFWGDPSALRHDDAAVSATR